jgi:hypothetical protein
VKNELEEMLVITCLRAFFFRFLKLCSSVEDRRFVGTPRLDPQSLKTDKYIYYGLFDDAINSLDYIASNNSRRIMPRPLPST